LIINYAIFQVPTLPTILFSGDGNSEKTENSEQEMAAGAGNTVTEAASSSNTESETAKLIQIPTLLLGESLFPNIFPTHDAFFVPYRWAMVLLILRH